MERSYAADNARELERLRALVSKLSDQDLGSMVNEYWTVAGVLGHMAFWDGRALFLAGKLQRDEAFTPSDAEAENVDWINDSTRPLIHAIPPRQAAEVAFDAPEDGEEFRRRVEESPLGSAVTFAGHVPYGPALFDLYDAHDVLVLPSFTEGFPQVVLEAMARGLPVVATSVGGVPRVLRDGINGRLVAPGDAEALAAAVTELVRDDSAAARLAAAGHATARGFTRSSQIRALNEFFDRCFPGKLPSLVHGAGR